MNLDCLNKMQQKAVLCTEGPVLVLAGAGSGKTRVLTHRAAYLIEEKGVPPYNILAITFTNKAAKEMQERIGKLSGPAACGMLISTFHSMCAKFLRRCASHLGYTNNFTIYDSQETATIIKHIVKDKDLDSQRYSPRYVSSMISAAKNSSYCMNPMDFFDQTYSSDKRELKMLYNEYQRRLKDENSMDFDDLLLNFLRVLKDVPEELDYYSRRFKYIMVDEYQDTNHVQYEIVRMLSSKHKNVFVVGDDDQSIYGWRGADIRNILDFESDYPNTSIIKLEQNYRSHDNILKTANAVISKNSGRMEKVLWSESKNGQKPLVYTAASEYDEAEYIARSIKELRFKGANLNNIAVLYRMNSMSRLLEEKMRVYAIPYKVYGGVSFYSRKEVKDIIAYLTLIVNPKSDTSFMRVINCPKRGIGDITVSKIITEAERRGISALEVSDGADVVFGKGAFVSKLKAFAGLITALRDDAEYMPPSQLILEIYEKSGYRAALRNELTAEAETREDNIMGLVNAAAEYEKNADAPTIAGFLEQSSLLTDMDRDESSDENVTLMTLHSAKGLEFDTVYIAGMEESLFPSIRAEQEDRLDEERRLCYVGITRAKNNLCMTHSVKRMLYGSEKYNQVSRFIDDISPELLRFDESASIKANKEALQRSREKKETRSSLPSFDFKPAFKPKATETSTDFSVGTVVEHPQLGEGEITEILGAGNQKIAVVDFENGMRKKMFLSVAPLTIKR